MNLFLRSLLLSTLLVFGSTAAGNAWAQSKGSHKHERDDSALPDSVRRAERQTGGEVLRAEPMQRDGREVYRLKVLTADGRVRVMQDDPQDRQSNQRQSRRQGNQRGSSQSDDSESDPPPY